MSHNSTRDNHKKNTENRPRNCAK